jgi:uncharacterized membrane protein YkvA (DUF1232 family)
MSELIHVLHRGASRITPQILRGVYKQLPLLKVEFAQINAPSFPHLNDQLDFLANVVEDFVDGKADELPYVTVCNAAFALIYAHRKMDLIPDFIPEIGRADDSGVVRAVLIENERTLSEFATKIGANWRELSTAH